MKKHLFSLITVAALVLTLMIPAAAATADSPAVLGDADGDRVLTILDATAIQRHLANKQLLPESAVSRSKVTGGSELTILDATAIQRRLARIIDRFPVEIVSDPSDANDPGVSPTEIEGTQPISDELNSYEEQVIRLVNLARRQYNLPALSADPDLCRVARIKAQDMHDAGYFDHTSPVYGSPFDMMLSFGIRYRAAGENIAYGYSTPEAVVNGWLNSQGHRENILSESYTKIGVGYVADGNYWAQLFIG